MVANIFVLWVTYIQILGALQLYEYYIQNMLEYCTFVLYTDAMYYIAWLVGATRRPMRGTWLGCDLTFSQ